MAFRRYLFPTYITNQIAILREGYCRMRLKECKSSSISVAVTQTKLSETENKISENKLL